MSDDFENIVQWDVHTDAITPQLEVKDPLSQFSEETLLSPSLPHNDTNNINVTLTESPTSSHFPKSPLTSHSKAQLPNNNQNGHTFMHNQSDNMPELSTMTIVIDDPKKHQDPTAGTYVTYLITTTTTLETFRNNGQPCSVRRRFQDFVWLHNTLTMEYPACIVPPLPDKHRLEYIKGDRFSLEFITKRKLSLQWFMNRISRHPILQCSQSTRIFLESNDFRNDKRAQSTYVPPTTSLINSIGDTLVNAFVKLKKPDEKFEEMKDIVNRLEDNLNIIERLYLRINKRQRDLQRDYTSFANSIQGLSALETSIRNSLHQFAETCKAYSKVMKEMSEKEELLFLNEIHELIAYCHAAKDVLKARDQKQLDFEELSRYLDQAVLEKERTLHPRFSDRGNITEYVADKINEVRGISMQQAKREKLARLERKIDELQNEVLRTSDESAEFSSQVVEEFSLFQKTKLLELKQGLLAYADCHIDFFQKGMDIWEKILPVLESIDSEKGDGEVTM
ncbi:intercellular trafficking and secretion [Rhizopus azygosporus]|uniref:Sorting nexin-4 n=1 Tax=Rhizopus azygosporus TaxID=86630 RepID=A0A367K785_RHIAZ|nr:intercellular trafficking and secretion [Rhizopus azygosporus]